MIGANTLGRIQHHVRPAAEVAAHQSDEGAGDEGYQGADQPDRERDRQPDVPEELAHGRFRIGVRVRLVILFGKQGLLPLLGGAVQIPIEPLHREVRDRTSRLTIDGAVLDARNDLVVDGRPTSRLHLEIGGFGVFVPVP
jgi:hypothetical protein